jgi:cyclic pyranopterin phosphate synthase
LSLTQVDVWLEIDRALPGVHVRAEARVVARTGVEMEALTAVTVALLTLYDMLKAVDRGMRIEGVRLTRKSGGRSGEWTAPDSDTSTK